MTESRGCSSVGSTVTPRLPRRPMDSQEACRARVRPWCPRAGRGTPARYTRQQLRAFFSPAQTAVPGGPGGRALKGPFPPGPMVSLTSARARGAGGGGRDALGPPGTARAVAALERRLTAALGGEALRTLQAAEGLFAARLPGRRSAGRLVSLPRARRLLWVLARLDRYADMGHGRPGAGLDVLERDLEVFAEMQAAGETHALPQHLGYFLPGLEATARRWKHTWAPRIKARRISEGRRATRLSPPGTPGTGGPAQGRPPHKFTPRGGATRGAASRRRPRGDGGGSDSAR
jgi:hypothetical protein